MRNILRILQLENIYCETSILSFEFRSWLLFREIRGQRRLNSYPPMLHVAAGSCSNLFSLQPSFSRRHSARHSANLAVTCSYDRCRGNEFSSTRSSRIPLRFLGEMCRSAKEGRVEGRVPPGSKLGFLLFHFV